MNWKTPENLKLTEAVLSLRTPIEARRFLRDIMTEVEIAEFANRLLVASMLSEKISYSRIQKETGLSTTTIARVSKWLQGKEGGYRLILNRIHHSATISRERGLR
ncbi:MAG: YerC/YecD family TrpR-related protein [bacterium]|nr:YerC/YecD family TrpR-related protein [bacterium]